MKTALQKGEYITLLQSRLNREHLLNEDLRHLENLSRIWSCNPVLTGSACSTVQLGEDDLLQVMLQSRLNRERVLNTQR